MQETAFVDSQGGLLSSRGGAQTHWHRHIGTSLTASIIPKLCSVNLRFKRGFEISEGGVRWRCRINNPTYNSD